MKFLTLITVLVATVVAAPTISLVARDERDNPSIPAIDDEKFIRNVMDAHWYWRRVHCAQDLQWDNHLAELALADVKTCTQDLYHHRAGSNLSGKGPTPKNRDDWIEVARSFVHGWHEEEMFYDYANHGSKNGRQIFHFSQLVWRDSTRVGCAMTDCSSVKDVHFPGRLYCYYENPGNNVAGNEFELNVWPPICADPSKAELEARYGS